MFNVNLNAIIKYNKTIDFLEKTDIKKNNPYFGYIDIEVCNLKFKMFSNNDDFVAKYYYWNGADSYEGYSTYIWYKLAKKSMNILDIGSYTGLYSLIASKSNTKAKVFAFEALDRVYSRLIINKVSNKCANMTCIFNAVSNKKEKINFNIFRGEEILTSGSSIELLENSSLNTIKEVESIDIDTFKLDYSLKRIDLIKIDVETAESKVLEGMKKTLKDDNPDILMEIFNSVKISYIDDILKKNNYKVFLINDKKREITFVEDIYAINNFSSMDELNCLLSTKSLEQINLLLHNEMY